MLPPPPRSGGASALSPTMSTGLRVAATAALLTWALVTSFLRLGAAPVYILNEAREGVYSRAMLDSGNFVLPSVPSHIENGETIPDKPPLVHWLSAGITALRVWVADGRLPASLRLAARYDEWSLRFPSGLTAVMTIAAVALLGRHLVGDRAALLAGAILLASWQFVHQARFGRVDMALCGCVTLTMLWAARALLDAAGWALVLAAAACGMAVLAKGPLGVVLPLTACATFVLLQFVRERSVERWRRLPWGRAVIVCAMVALPWYCAAFSQAGMAFVRSQLLDETLEQFTGGTSRMWVFYYVLPWLQDTAPWNLFALLGAWRAWRLRDPRAAFCVVWWVSFLAVFQLSAYKRQAYLLPAVPASALLAGYGMDRWLVERGRSVRDEIVAALPVSWSHVLGGTLVAAIIGVTFASSRVPQQWLGTTVLPIDGALGGAGIALSAVALFALGRALVRQQLGSALAAVCAAEVMIFLGPVATGEIIVAQQHTPVTLVQRMVADLVPDKTVTAIGLGDDKSLLLLFYFPTLTRIAVVPQAAGIPAMLPPGYYLLSTAVWAQLTAPDPAQPGDAPAGSPWRFLWADALRERGGTIPLVFAERVE